MRVRWIGDARTVAGLGTPIAGHEYDVSDAMGASLIEQGKAEAVVAAPLLPVPPARVLPCRPIVEEEE